VEDQLGFPVIYTNGRAGIAKKQMEDESTNLRPLFEAILEHTPPPAGDPDEVLQLLVANLDYSDYLGRLAIGRVFNGTSGTAMKWRLRSSTARCHKTKITKLYSFEGLKRVDETVGRTGDILASRAWKESPSAKPSPARKRPPPGQHSDRRAHHSHDVHHQHLAVFRARGILCHVA